MRSTLELILIALLPVLALVVMIMEWKSKKLQAKGLGAEDLDNHTETPGVDHKAIARRLYDYLKAGHNHKAITTRYAMEKVFGRPRAEYHEGAAGYDLVYPDFTLVDYDLYKIDEQLTDLIDQEGIYEADFSRSEGQLDRPSYDIPFILKKKSSENL